MKPHCVTCKEILKEKEVGLCNKCKRGNELLKKYDDDLHDVLNFGDGTMIDDYEVTGLYIEESCIGDALVNCKDDSMKFYAWCECGDSLEAKEIKDNDGMITTHEYYCIGCDKTYVLTEKK